MEASFHDEAALPRSETAGDYRNRGMSSRLRPNGWDRAVSGGEVAVSIAGDRLGNLGSHKERLRTRGNRGRRARTPVPPVRQSRRQPDRECSRAPWSAASRHRGIHARGLSELFHRRRLVR